MSDADTVVASSEARRRSTHTIRMTDSEYAHVRALARDNKVNAASYVRTRALKHEFPPEIQKSSSTRLRRVGLALNQVVTESKPWDIGTGRDQPNAEEIAQNLAGVASSRHVTMQAVLLAFRVIAGAEYFIHDRVAFDLWARLLLSEEFNGTIVWDPLRNHVPNLRRDGSEPVHGVMSSDDLSAVVLSFGMKYCF